MPGLAANPAGTVALRKALDSAREHIETKGTAFMQALVLEAFRRVSARTPVDTGRARGNWHLTSGAPSEEVDHNRFDPSGAIGLAEAEAEIPAVGIIEPSYVVNNIEYIGALEHGHSKQVPPGGIVALTVAELGPIADGLVRQLGD